MMDDTHNAEYFTPHSKQLLKAVDQTDHQLSAQPNVATPAVLNFLGARNPVSY